VAVSNPWLAASALSDCAILEHQESGAGAADGGSTIDGAAAAATICGSDRAGSGAAATGGVTKAGTDAATWGRDAGTGSVAAVGGGGTGSAIAVCEGGGIAPTGVHGRVAAASSAGGREASSTAPAEVSGCSEAGEACWSFPPMPT
jgi:hypothetical protein